MMRSNNSTKTIGADIRECSDAAALSSPGQQDLLEGSDDVMLSKIVTARLEDSAHQQSSEKQESEREVDTKRRHGSVMVDSRRPQESDFEGQDEDANLTESTLKSDATTETSSSINNERCGKDSCNAPTGIVPKEGLCHLSVSNDHDAPGAYAFAPNDSDVASARHNVPINEQHPGPCRPRSESGTAIGPIDLANAIPVANPVDGGPIDASSMSATAQPNNEDLEAQASRTEKIRKTTFLQLLFLLPIALLLIVAATVAAVLLSRKDDQQQVLVPTGSPSESPSMVPSQVLEGDIAIHLFPDYTLQSLENPESPQSQAYSWLLDDVALNDYSYTSDRVLQRFALATFYYATIGTDWYHQDNWLNHSVHECFWYSQGYFLDSGDVFTYVEALHPNPCELPSKAMKDIAVPTGHLDVYVHLWLGENNNLKGTLPAEVFWLTDLRSMSLYTNPDMTGTIPSYIGQLTNLEAINLGNTGISGPLPSELGLLSDSLYSIAIINAQLTGALPSELGLLHELHDLLVDINMLSGTIPPEFSNLSNMKWIYLSENLFTGSFPEMLTDLPWQQFYLDHNHFTGTLPTSLGLMTTAEKFVVYNNDFTGIIPTEIALMDSVHIFDVDGNELTGTIPTEVGILPNLTQFWACCNALTGTIPTHLGQSSTLTLFVMDQNSLHGTIPTELGLPTLQDLSLSENNLSGTFPTEIGPDFLWLELSHNPLLNGTVSPDWNITDALNITGTNLSGTLPDTVCEMNYWLDFDCSSFLCGCTCSCDSGNSTSTIISSRNSTL